MPAACSIPLEAFRGQRLASGHGELKLPMCFFLLNRICLLNLVISRHRPVQKPMYLRFLKAMLASQGGVPGLWCSCLSFL